MMLLRALFQMARLLLVLLTMSFIAGMMFGAAERAYRWIIGM